MQLKFKNQRYQEDAALAVVSVFHGQPKDDAYTYLRDRSQKALRKGMLPNLSESFVPRRACLQGIVTAITRQACELSSR